LRNLGIEGLNNKINRLKRRRKDVQGRKRRVKL
jgi:hypothetical protein